MPVYSLIPTPSQLSRREELSTNIKLYQGTRAARRRMQAELEELGQRRNLPLPPELMGIIFDFYVHVYDQLPERLLLVCRAWHVLALSQRALWTNLDPLGPFGLPIIRPWAGTFLQSRIARSNPAPLKVNFSNCSRNILFKDTKKIANISTFRSRIQDLTITSIKDLVYAFGDPPVLKDLGYSGFFQRDKLIANPPKCKLFEKMVTTLRLRCEASLALPIWPESLLRRLQTLELVLPNDLEARRGGLAIMKKSTALLTLHIIMTFDGACSLSHASCQNLTITYSSYQCSLEEIRMPRLQALTIVTYTFKGLSRLTLVDTSISSLQLTWMFPGSYEDLDQAARVGWVDDAIRLLRSAPRLERFSISAPFGFVAGLLEAIAEDPNLCVELNTFIIDGPAGISLVAKGENVEAKFDMLRRDAAAFINQRRLQRLKN